MPTTAQATLLVIGHLLLGGLFVYGGVRHLFILPALTQAVAGRTPAPRLVILAGTALQICAGALLMAGLFVAAASLALVVFTAAACVLMLNFWDLPPGPEREAAKNQWLSNAAIVGGLLVSAAQALG